MFACAVDYMRVQRGKSFRIRPVAIVSTFRRGDGRELAELMQLGYERRLPRCYQRLTVTQPAG
jgi:hypothetical protein